MNNKGLFTKKMNFTLSVCMMFVSVGIPKEVRRQLLKTVLSFLCEFRGQTHLLGWCSKCFATKPYCHLTNSILIWNLYLKPPFQKAYIHACSFILDTHTHFSLKVRIQGKQAEWMHEDWMSINRCGQRWDAQKFIVAQLQIYFFMYHPLWIQLKRTIIYFRPERQIKLNLKKILFFLKSLSSLKIIKVICCCLRSNTEHCFHSWTNWSQSTSWSGRRAVFLIWIQVPTCNIPPCKILSVFSF